MYFKTLHPGNAYIWFLGQAPALFEETTGVPRRWELEAEYTGTLSDVPFYDSSVIDLDVEKRIELRIDPLIRIGKDLEEVGSQLGAIKKAIPNEVMLTAASFASIGERWGRRKPVRPRARRAPSWR